MNAYGIFILCALLLDYSLRLCADLLNVRALDAELPREFEGVYDPELYRRSQEYTRVRTRFGLLTSTFQLGVVLCFWLLGGFETLDRILRATIEGELWRGLSYMGLLFGAQMLLGLPFQLYSTFRIEERFGFNKTDVRTFWADRLKGLVLAVVLGAPLLALVLTFFDRAGDAAWLYAWGATAAFVVGVQFLFPTWILPLFNKFTPLEEGELRTSILDYARSVDFGIDNLYVIDGSRRTTKSNAFFTGFGRHKRIALFDTLIENHSTPELLAVVAHEIGHYKKKHIIQGMFLSVAQAGVLFFLLGFFLSQRGLFEAFYMREMSIYAGFVFFGLLYTPIELVLSVVLLGLSRRNEFEADRFAAQTTGAQQPMAEALKRLSRENLANLTPHPMHVVLNHSHPPVLRRIEALGRLASTPA